MKRHPFSLYRLLALPTLTVLLGANILWAQDKPVTPVSREENPPPAALAGKSSKVFNDLADQALVAMKKQAEQMKVQGVAVVAYFEGDSAQSWSSKMVVVGKLKNPPSQNDPGANLLAIAYTKASEMADTLKHSGSGARPPMKGEFGWQGGLIAKGKTGYVIAAFSGASSEDDVKVSHVGLDILASGL